MTAEEYLKTLNIGQSNQDVEISPSTQAVLDSLGSGKRYTVESDPNIYSLENAQKFQTVDTQTGKPVSGRVYKFDDAAMFAPDETPLYKAPKPPENNWFNNLVGSYGSGFNQALSGLAGMPVNAISGLMGLVGAAPNKPVMGSEWIQENLLPKPYPSQGLSGNIANRLGQETFNAMTAAVPMARGGATGTQLLKAGAPSAIGAGTAAGIAATAAPNNPLAEIGASVLGGTLPQARSIASAVAGPLYERLSTKAPNWGSSVVEALTPKNEQNLDKLITYNYNKAIRPSVQGKQGYADWKKSQERANVAVKEIVHDIRNRNGQLPQNVEEFSREIQNARNNIYDEYSAMTKATNATGITVPVNALATDLERIADGKIMSRYGKQAADYAKKLAADLRTDKAFTPQEAEELIALWNSKLKGYYGNRTSGLSELTASMTDTAARYLRSALDEAIENAHGSGYQSLKNKYGALRSIEKDVMNRAVVDARKNQAGLLDFSDMFSMSKGVYAVAKLDPAGAAAAGAMLALKQHMKASNDPNLRVRKLFESVDKYLPKREKFYGPEKRELGFQMGALEGEAVPSTKALVPTGASRGNVVDAEYTHVTPLTGGQRAGLLEAPKGQGVISAPWNPVNKPGAVAERLTQYPTDVLMDALTQELRRRGKLP